MFPTMGKTIEKELSNELRGLDAFIAATRTFIGNAATKGYELINERSNQTENYQGSVERSISLRMVR